MRNIFSILTVVFIVLKLTHYIEWSWWLVFSPMYVGFIFYTAVLVTYIHLRNRG